MTTMLRGLSVGFVAALLAAGAGADDVAEAMRGIVAKHGDAIVQVKLTLKQTYTIPEYGTEVEESTEEILATVISPDGLMVTSLMETDPAAWMEDLFEDEEGFDSKTELTGIRVLRDGTEEDAEIVLRDQDLDLAFLRPVKKPETPRAFVDLSQAVTAEAFDRVFLLERLGKVVQRVATAYETRIAAVQERPRRMYVLGGFTGDGAPVFLMQGNCLGIHVTRSLRANRQNGLGMQDDGFNMESIVVPGADIVEIAKQAPPYKGE